MTLIVSLFYNCVVLPMMQLLFWGGSLFPGKLRDRQRALRASHPLRRINASGLRISDYALHTATVWLHAASMGELEQLKPVIKRIHALNNDVRVFVSVFSVSGIMSAQRLEQVHHAFVLPLDSIWTMRRLVKGLKPTLVIFNRYDVWPNLVRSLRKSNVPMILANATLPSSSSNGFLRRWIAGTYSYLSEIFAIDASHATMLEKLLASAPKHQSMPIVSQLYDTRCDTVLDKIASNWQEVEQYRRNSQVTIVVGSSWHDDEMLFVEALEVLSSQYAKDNAASHRRLRLIFVPHEPTPPAIQRITQLIPATLWSKATPDTDGHLIVDSVGLLLSLYSIADAAFVGGGFGAGVHSVTEPGVYGVPVSCGPYISRASDAMALRQENLLCVITNGADLAAWINEVVLNDVNREDVGNQTRTLLRRGQGAADTLAAHLVKRYLT